MDALYTQSANHFTQKFQATPAHSIFAPGRANIIGEHTDYNDGFVLPFATTLGVWFHASPNNSGVLSVFAGNTGEHVAIFPQNPQPTTYGWEKFFIQALGQLPGHAIQGADILFEGNLPVGAGMSSSSAITCGFIAILNYIFRLNMDADAVLWAAVRAERGYGVQGGIMDQFTILNGRRDAAILLDCRYNRSLHIPLHLHECRFYMFHSNVHHNLIDTDYNNRSAACREAVSLLQSAYPGIKSLRDLTTCDLPFIGSLLDKELFLKVKFVIEENARVALAVQSLKDEDMHTLGNLLYASHKGLSALYEVSCPELDWLVDYTQHHTNIYGARMMGGGFGGCTINLVEGVLSEAFKETLLADYQNIFGIKPEIFEVTTENGILFAY
jgi:galactokinase